MIFPRFNRNSRTPQTSLVHAGARLRPFGDLELGLILSSRKKLSAVRLEVKRRAICSLMAYRHLNGWQTFATDLHRAFSSIMNAIGQSPQLQCLSIVTNKV